MSNPSSGISKKALPIGVDACRMSWPANERVNKRIISNALVDAAPDYLPNSPDHSLVADIRKTAEISSGFVRNSQFALEIAMASYLPPFGREPNSLRLRPLRCLNRYRKQRCSSSAHVAGQTLMSRDIKPSWTKLDHVSMNVEMSVLIHSNVFSTTCRSADDVLDSARPAQA
jgi:hypothetical protein